MHSRPCSYSTHSFQRSLLLPVYKTKQTPFLRRQEWYTLSDLIEINEGQADIWQAPWALHSWGSFCCSARPRLKTGTASPLWPPPGRILRCFFRIWFWWLILCVNLIGLSAAPIVGKTLFGMSVRVCLEDFHSWNSRLSKEHPHECRWSSSNLLRAWVEQTGGKRQNSTCLSWDISLLLP